MPSPKSSASIIQKMWRKLSSTKKPKKRRHRPCKNCGEPVERGVDGDFKGECEDCIENAQQQIDDENMGYGEGRRGTRRRGSR